MTLAQRSEKNDGWVSKPTWEHNWNSAAEKSPRLSQEDGNGQESRAEPVHIYSYTYRKNIGKIPKTIPIEAN